MLENQITGKTVRFNKLLTPSVDGMDMMSKTGDNYYIFKDRGMIYDVRKHLVMKFL